MCGEEGDGGWVTVRRLECVRDKVGLVCMMECGDREFELVRELISMARSAQQEKV